MTNLKKLIENMVMFRDNCNKEELKEGLITFSVDENGKDNPEAYDALGYYYQFIEIDEEKMVKYYKKAIKDGWVKSMITLGYYYERKREYTLSKKYYKMASKIGSVDAMFRLGCHYQFVKYNYDKMMKYYVLAINQKSKKAMEFLEEHCHNTSDPEHLMDALEIFYEYNQVRQWLWVFDKVGEISDSDRLLNHLLNIKKPEFIRELPLILRKMMSLIQLKLNFQSNLSES